MADKPDSPQVTPGQDVVVALQLTAVGSPRCLLQSIPMRSVPPVFAFQKSPSPCRVSVVTLGEPMWVICRIEVAGALSLPSPAAVLPLHTRSCWCAAVTVTFSSAQLPRRRAGQGGTLTRFPSCRQYLVNGPKRPQDSKCSDLSLVPAVPPSQRRHSPPFSSAPWSCACELTDAVIPASVHGTDGSIAPI